MKVFILSLLFGALIMAAAYHQRGYWAVGAEVVLSIVLLIILLRTEKEI